MRYDLAVIGAGPGGYVAAIRAAQLGMKVAVIESREAGGTCLNRGCIPTKTLLHSAEAFDRMRHCEALGVSVSGCGYDMEKMHARKNEIVGQLRSGIEQLFRANKIDLYRGTGTILSAGAVAVKGEGSEETVEAGKILIATGSEPAVPPVPGLDLPGVLTSDGLLAGPVDPKRLLIIGGGVIGVEFASLYQRLGCEVTIVEALDRLLPNMDREISQNLSMIFKKRGVSVHTSARVEEIVQEGEALVCRFTEKGKTGEAAAERILLAIGRRAATEGLFAEGVSVETERGAVKVNERFETSLPGVYAIGDVIFGGVQLAHAASAEGIAAVEGMAGEAPSVNLSVVPSCIYTQPEIASAGITADEAKQRGAAVKTGKFIMTANGKTLIEGADRSFVKLVFSAEDDRLLGAQLMCPRATDLISELAAAIANGLTGRQLASVIRPHPTFCEAVTEAVEAASGKAIHAAPPRR